MCFTAYCKYVSLCKLIVYNAVYTPRFIEAFVCILVTK